MTHVDNNALGTCTTVYNDLDQHQIEFLRQQNCSINTVKITLRHMSLEKMSENQTGIEQ